MDPADKTASAGCIRAWGFALARARWHDLLHNLPPGRAHPRLLFNGPFADFVARGRKQHGKGSRAMAETNVTILVLQTIEGVAIDLTPHARFLDRLEPPRYVAHRRARLRL